MFNIKFSKIIKEFGSFRLKNEIEQASYWYDRQLDEIEDKINKPKTVTINGETHQMKPANISFFRKQERIMRFGEE